MMVGFLPIFVADTKVLHDYNFVAPIKCTLKLNFKSV